MVQTTLPPSQRNGKTLRIRPPLAPSPSSDGIASPQLPSGDGRTEASPRVVDATDVDALFQKIADARAESGERRRRMALEDALVRRSPLAEALSIGIGLIVGAVIGFALIGAALWLVEFGGRLFS